MSNYNYKYVWKLLIIDKATTYDIDEFKSASFNNAITISYIPEGLTSILQLLDASIIKPFKDALRNEHTQYCYKKGLNNNEKISREQIIDFVIWRMV